MSFRVRHLLRTSLLAVVSLAFAALRAAAATPPVNVLMIVVDDLNVALGCYDDPLARTPHIDRLAARGVTFTRAYSQYPLCNPSRVSFLTGRRPETTGVYVLNTPARTAAPDAVMLPQFFRNLGYFTAGAGKIFHNARVNDASSWDHYQDAATQDPEEREAIRSRYEGGDGRPAWTVLTTEGELTRDVVNGRQARAWISAQAEAGKPFFVAAGFHNPHLPWTAPKRFFDLHRTEDFAATAYPTMQDVPAIALQTELTGFSQPDSPAAARRAYYAAVSFIDEQIGGLLDELDQRDLWSNTIVVFLSDHGFHLGDHDGLWAKLSAFDQATRVPLIIAGAGVPAGRRVHRPVELLDLYPTLADLTGHAAPAGLEGDSLTATWSPGATAEGQAYSLVYHYDKERDDDVEARTVIARDWRYTEWDGGRTARELYLRTGDASEYRNLAMDDDTRNLVQAGADLLRRHPQPKPGPANRPRALLPARSK
jgi:uncharacterized sulfatase